MSSGPEHAQGTICNPYANLTAGRWMKGNLHAHTTRSDGKSEPQAVIDRYADAGHDFLMISDHDIYTSAADHAKWNARGLILIPGNEVSAHGPHLLHVDANQLIPPHMPRQRVITAANQAGGFLIAAHPNWQAAFDHTSISQLMEWSPYMGLEIYNGVIGRLDGSPYATNKWDMLLSQGRKLWGFANDDSHDPTRNDYILGWNVAWVTQPTSAGVVEALKQGRFYASTGVEITDIEVSGRTIRIRTANAQRIIALQQIGRRFAQADGNTIEVTVPDQATYVRFECWGEGEKMAWTQPFYCTPIAKA